MARYLLVANQTLGGASLEREIRRCIDEGHDDFHVVVPMTQPAYEAAAWVPADPAFAVPALPAETYAEAEDEARRRSEHRLARMLEKIEDLGGRADGEIGSSDPITAIRGALEDEEFDAIILSTLPAGLSRWLGMDLPSRVERMVDIPVTTVEAEA